MVDKWIPAFAGMTKKEEAGRKKNTAPGCPRRGALSNEA
jgi:hypothetical protein